MSKKLEALISSLDEAKVNLKTEAEKKLLANFISKLDTDERNWISGKILEAITVVPGLMQDQNKLFQDFCSSLENPIEINPDEFPALFPGRKP